MLRHEHAGMFQGANHRLGTCTESCLASPWNIISFAGKTSSLINGADRLNTMLFTYNKIIVAMGRCRVHHTSPTIGSYVGSREHRATATDRWQWMHTLPANHVCARQHAPNFQDLAKRLFQRIYTSSRYHVPLATARLNLQNNHAAESVSAGYYCNDVAWRLAMPEQSTGRKKTLPHCTVNLDERTAPGYQPGSKES